MYLFTFTNPMELITFVMLRVVSRDPRYSSVLAESVDMRLWSVSVKADITLSLKSVILERKYSSGDSSVARNSKIFL